MKGKKKPKHEVIPELKKALAMPKKKRCESKNHGGVGGSLHIIEAKSRIAFYKEMRRLEKIIPDPHTQKGLSVYL